MFCQYCGAKLEDGAKFCTNCGAPVTPEKKEESSGTSGSYSSASQASGSYTSGSQNSGSYAPNGYTRVEPQSFEYDRSAEDTGSFCWGLLGFCIPLVGLILYLVWKDEKPRTAKIAGKGALIAVVLSVVFEILTAVLGIGAGILGSFF